MAFTIKEVKPFVYEKNKAVISMPGYSFVDTHGHCICIVYGKSRRDFMAKYLN